MTSNIRTEYDKRDCLQERLHRTYGEFIYLLDIDSMCDSGAGLKIFMEYDRSGSIAYCDFKNDNEEIKLWKLKPMINDATKLGIPAYISVIYRNPVICYRIIPLNDLCKKMIKTDRWMSEQTYIKFLHFIRKIEVNPQVLEGKCNIIPQNLPLPNIM